MSLMSVTMNFQAEMQLDEKQENAVMAAVRNGIMILTGGPGTGKTTTINAMIEYFHSENMEIMLAAPTGRAAKRMTRQPDGKRRRSTGFWR